MTLWMRRFDCGEDWVEILGDHDHEDNYDVESAAEEFCEKNYTYWEYPSGPIEVEVKDENDSTTVVEVEVETQPVFSASVQKYQPTRPCAHTDPSRDVVRAGVCFMCNNKV